MGSTVTPWSSKHLQFVIGPEGVRAGMQPNMDAVVSRMPPHLALPPYVPQVLSCAPALQEIRDESCALRMEEVVP